MLTLTLAISLFFLIVPIMYGIYHLGVVMLFFFCVLIGVEIWLLKRRGRLLRVWSGILIAAVLAETAFSGVMFGAVFHTKPEDSAQTMVVLGCAVVGEEPSKMLENRLKGALKILDDNPDMPVITTGGIGKNASISEADCAKAWLIKNGIAEDRIYTDTKSTNTAENLKYTSEIIEENNLPTEIYIATDPFHQLRAHILSQSQNLRPVTALCASPWGLVPTYWLREQAGVVYTLLAKG